MASLQEQSVFTPEIYQIETTDLVQGGPNGTANKQIIELANRTRFLYDNLYVHGKFAAVEPFTANTAITNAAVGKLLLFTGNAGVVCTIAALNTFTQGQIITIKSIGVNSAPVTVTAANTLIFINNVPTSSVWLHAGEILQLVATPNGWVSTQASETILQVGECVDSYRTMPNTVVRRGQILNRADFPRLWNWITNSLTAGEQVVSDAVWQSSTVLNTPSGPVTIFPYQGCFSTGDGTTTFRVPDDRGMFTRYLDLNRGIDLDRIHAFAGGYQNDAFKEHRHLNGMSDNGQTNYVYGSTTEGMPGLATQTITGENLPRVFQGWTQTVGNSETRPQNNAKLPLLRI